METKISSAWKINSQAFEDYGLFFISLDIVEFDATIPTVPS
jgi:hypothetical protein